MILLPDIRPESILQGRREGDAPKKYTGGIGEKGLFALRDFVHAGGTVIALDSSSGLLIDGLELPVRLMPRAEDEKARFFCPGSLLRVNVEPTHPLAYGLDAAIAIMFSNSPVFEVVEKEEDKTLPPPILLGDGEPTARFVAGYPRVNPLLSGWIENDEAIRGKGALVEVDFNPGKAVLVGFRCQFRAQSHGTFKVLFNAILDAGTD